MADDEREFWTDDIRGDITGAPEAVEQFKEWEEQGLGDPSLWDSYDLFIDGDDHVRATVTSEGFEYTVDISADLSDLAEWDWLWDIWDWLEAEYDDVDLDSQYSEQ